MSHDVRALSLAFLSMAFICTIWVRESSRSSTEMANVVDDDFSISIVIFSPFIVGCLCIDVTMYYCILSLFNALAGNKTASSFARYRLNSRICWESHKIKSRIRALSSPHPQSRHSDELIEICELAPLTSTMTSTTAACVDGTIDGDTRTYKINSLWKWFEMKSLHSSRREIGAATVTTAPRPSVCHRTLHWNTCNWSAISVVCASGAVILFATSLFEFFFFFFFLILFCSQLCHLQLNRLAFIESVF